MDSSVDAQDNSGDVGLDSDTEESLLEVSDSPDSADEDCSMEASETITWMTSAADDKEKAVGNREFWMWEYDTGANVPLKIAALPKSSDKVSSLQLIAASQYAGSPEALPKELSSFVHQVQATKALIFGLDVDDYPAIENAFPKTKDYHVLCTLFVQLLSKIRSNALNQAEDEATADFLYDYRVSLNGVLCGTMRGPKQITRAFIRWIHLNFALYRNLRIHNLKREWAVCGFKVYHFTPIPDITLLRLFLRDSETQQLLLLHITRQIDKP